MLTQKMVIVLKFGGTSVADPANWPRMADIIKQHTESYQKVLVVCSAPAGVSDGLVGLIDKALGNDDQHTVAKVLACFERLAHSLAIDFDECLRDAQRSLTQLIEGIALLKEASPRTKARVLAWGELLLTQLGVCYLRREAIDVEWHDTRHWLTAQDHLARHQADHYLQASCEDQADPSLQAKLAAVAARVLIMPGFIASGHRGDTVLLGRGESDVSAAYLAAKLAAQRCEIWTDVPGIYTANPQVIPEARLLKQLNYAEAQEIASMGGKVLHPNCIAPLAKSHIPLAICYTAQPSREGTIVSTHQDPREVPIKSIQTKTGIMLITISTFRMWRRVGFLADVFACFKRHGLSIDCVSTSESSVTVSLDENVASQDSQVIHNLIKDLTGFAKAHVISHCAAVSIIGSQIRAVLHQFSEVFQLFKEHPIHLLSQAANDLNLTVIVDESQVVRLAQKCHALLIEQGRANHYFNESWRQEFGVSLSSTPLWWESSQVRQDLLSLAQTAAPCYVYSESSCVNAVNSLKDCEAIDRIFYAVKANYYPPILHLFADMGLNFECVSIAEVKHLLNLMPDMDRQRILFTPNFAERGEYQQALELGVILTIDSLYPLQNWGEMFARHTVLLRIDPGQGAGHHKYVVTGGNESKFGISLDSIAELKQLVARHDIQVIGLHAHSGSGILDASRWSQAAQRLIGLLHDFPTARVINLGGGLGIPDRPSQAPLDLQKFNDNCRAIKQAHPQIELWLEPGRFLVARSGVLLTKVTQVKQKGETCFVGVSTGMNSLIRPALYGAYHNIVNLTRWDDAQVMVAHIVGPICESGDTIGYSRALPATQEGDVMLVANVGAYGYCMSSSYNLREPAEQHYFSTCSAQ